MQLRRRGDASRRARPRAGSRRARARAASARCACSPTRSAGRGRAARTPSAAISALDSRLAPLPHQSRPNHVPTVAWRSRRRELGQAGHADRPVVAVDDRGTRAAPRARAWPPAPRCRPRAARARVRAPGEPARHLGVGAELEQPRRVRARGVAQPQRAARRRRAGRTHVTAPMLYTRRAGAALRRARQPAGARGGARPTPAARGADRWLLGGDYALFGGWPEESVAAPARALGAPSGSAATASAGPRSPATRPTTRSSRARSRRAARRSARRSSSELAELPFDHAERRHARLPRAPRVSDVRSFLPEPADDEAELLAGVTARRLVFGHTHLPFRRERDGIELVNPGLGRDAVRRRPARGLRARARRRRDRAPPRRPTTTRRAPRGCASASAAAGPTSWRAASSSARVDVD